SFFVTFSKSYYQTLSWCDIALRGYSLVLFDVALNACLTVSQKARSTAVDYAVSRWFYLYKCLRHGLFATPSYLKTPKAVDKKVLLL
ncbi:MAG: hypothetical protein PVG49_08785, partial [Desulfobacteraceae bacterium]